MFCILGHPKSGFDPLFLAHTSEGFLLFGLEQHFAACILSLAHEVVNLANNLLLTFSHFLARFGLLLLLPDSQVTFCSFFLHQQILKDAFMTKSVR